MENNDNRINKIKNHVDRLNKTEKGRLILKLCRYLAFLLVVFLLVIVGSILGNKKYYGREKVYREDPIESVESIESEVNNTYLEKQEILLTGKYSFVFEISKSTSVKFTGTFDNGLTDGYRENSSGVIKYQIENGNTYIVNGDTKTLYNDLYNGLLPTLFDFKYIFSKLNNRSTIMGNSGSGRTYSYEDIDGYNIVVTSDNEHITNITIENDILKYDYKFTY